MTISTPNFFYPNKGCDKFTIEHRHINKLVLYYYDEKACFCRPIAVVGADLSVDIPFLGLSAKGVILISKTTVEYQYPDLIPRLGIKTKLINKQNSLTSEIIAEVYLRSIANNFNKIKYLFEQKWKTSIR